MKMPFVFQGRRSKVKVVLSHSRKTLLAGYSSRIIQLRTIDHNDERKMPIIFQGQRSKVKVVLSHSKKTL